MSQFASNIETPRKIGQFVKAYEASLHNGHVFLQEFEKVAEELDQIGQANFNLKEQLRKAIEHNNALQSAVEKINNERKDATKNFTEREDGTAEILRANRITIQEDKGREATLAELVKRLQTEVMALKQTQKIQADELATKDTELGAADADATSKDATWTNKLNNMQNEKIAAIGAKLDCERRMTEQSEEIIELRRENVKLKMDINQGVIDLAKARDRGQNELTKVTIKY
jgi:chromosome segregation ATPase